jgi:hypothetical protein
MADGSSASIRRVDDRRIDDAVPRDAGCEIALHIQKATPMPDLALAVSRLVNGDDGRAATPAA